MEGCAGMAVVLVCDLGDVLLKRSNPFVAVVRYDVCTCWVVACTF